MERRIIAIQMLPKAYDEIQRLKGEETWTRFIIQCVLAKAGDNSILKDELASLTKESKEQKPKAEKKAKKEKEEAIRAYQEAGRAFTRAICAEGHTGDLTGNLPITSRLRYHCATRAAPLPALVT